MSTDDRERRDPEIDLGRYVRRVLSRWYVVVASVVIAVLIASLGGSEGRQTTTARALLFLGQPFTPNTQPINASFCTNPATPGILIRQDQFIEAAAAKAGLRPAQLKGHVSTQPQSGALSKANYTPIVGLTVQGDYGRKTALAANAMAEAIVSYCNRYPRERARVLSNLITQQRAAVASLTARRDQSLQSLQKLQRQGADVQLILSATAQLSTAEQALATLSQNLGDNEQSLALAQQVERSQVVSRAAPVRVTAGSKRASYGVAILLGLVVGIVLALVLAGVHRPLRNGRNGEQAES